MRRGAPALLLFAALACGGGPRAAVDDAVRARELEGALEAYDQFREADGADGALLAEVAALLLELEALGEDESRRDAALTQLRLAGNAALPVLERIGRSEGETVARAEALAHLTRRGDGEARAYLYALLDTDDPAILAPALVAVDPEEETARLQLQWRASAQPALGEEDVDLDALLGEQAQALDLFDAVQLRAVVAVCRRSRSLSEAGRTLFAVSRDAKAKPNDADRLKKYLARFGLAWDDVAE